MRGMSPADLDRELGKRPGFVARTWLRTQRQLPNNDDVMAAAKALRISFEWLRYGIGSASDPPPPDDQTAIEATWGKTLEDASAAKKVAVAERRVPGKRRRSTLRKS